MTRRGWAVIAVPLWAIDVEVETCTSPECEYQTTYLCSNCEAEVTPRHHIASEFLIVAHAELHDALLTCDAWSFRDYFDLDGLSIRTD